uniref:protein disulfide-isomerase n=2 Tax=Rhodosorus marinus TaxID=101924 RepID=A0A7S3A3V6_9RHOD|mmetsp:Transcript_43808/g.171326  ORF Transcript_43808/g.171326 Transcript_43808/m.171326 type:complete len:412 (+) Transcript_43808:475-1710(+)
MIQDYSGGRDRKSIVNFMVDALRPILSEITKDGIADLMKDEKAAFVMISGDEAKEAEFEKIARAAKGGLAGNGAFYKASAADAEALIAKSKASAGQVIVKTFGDDDADYSTVDVSEELGDICKGAATPIFGELSRDTAQTYIESPCVILFAEPGNAKHDDQKKVMTAAAKQLRGNGKVLFAWIDAKELGSFKDQLGVTADPAIAIVEFDGLTKYLFEEEFTADAVAAWAKKYIAGELTPNLKSAPKPEKNDEPVKIVVGSTWEELVMDDTKDVLVEQYAPWCGHCKKLAPVYDELASVLSDVESIVIAKMDATENDAPPPHAAKGYPTLTFFPAGKKDKPIPYNGGRTVREFAEFLQKNCGTSFELPEGLGSAEADAPEEEEEPEDDDYEGEYEDYEDEEEGDEEEDEEEL